MFIIFQEKANTFSLADLAPIAQVIIAFLNVCFAIYIFRYEKRKDKSTLAIQEHKIKLQGFRDLLLLPNISVINNFYSNIIKNCNSLTAENCNEQLKQEINESNKKELSDLRIKFIQPIKRINRPLHEKLSQNLDNLIDGITNLIFTEPVICDRNEDGQSIFDELIVDSKNKLLFDLLSYDGS